VLRQERFGVTNKITQEVLFEVRLGVWGFESAETIETGEKTLIEIGNPAENSGITEPTADGIRLVWCDLVEQLAETFNRNRFQPVSLVSLKDCSTRPAATESFL
jgi:hypothetical protein